LLLTFVLGLGVTGVWLGLVAGLSLACVLLMARFWRRP
jgi:MATE family multidrug resistance protein